MYKIIKSKRKSIAAKIDENGRIIICAPYFVNKQTINRFFNENKTKILNFQNQVVENINKRKNFKINGTLKLLGMDFPVIYKDKVSFENNKFFLPDKDFSLIKNDIISLYKNLAKNLILDRIEYYKDKIGVDYNFVKIKSVKSRWGSCSSKKNLNFSWKLVMANIKIVDYVVVHELCHLKEMNHSEKFWREVEKILPDYKVRIKMLRDFEDTLKKENWD